MKSVLVDKTASVAQHNDLTSEVRLSPDIPCEEGVLVAARVLNKRAAGARQLHERGVSAPKRALALTFGFRSTQRDHRTPSFCLS